MYQNITSYFSDIISSNDITTTTIILRLSLSFVIGVLVGIERETRRQPAGLRTHILIAIGSTILMMLSIFVPQTFPNFQNGDPSRIAAQVVSGIGFLGAGAIIKYGTNIRGLTTAASIWVIAALGLTVGAGMYLGAIIGTAILLTALVLLNHTEKRHFTKHFYKILDVYTLDNNVSIQDLLPILQAHNVKVHNTDIEHFYTEDKTNFSLTIQFKSTIDMNSMITKLSNIKSVQKISLRQIV